MKPQNNATASITARINELAPNSVFTPQILSGGGDTSDKNITHQNKKRLQSASHAQRPQTQTQHQQSAIIQHVRQQNPMIPRGPTFTEKDLFKAANTYGFLDKNQHFMGNKMFAQSSINQVKLQKQSDKFNQMFLEEGEDGGGQQPTIATFTHAPSQLTMQTNNFMGGSQPEQVGSPTGAVSQGKMRPQSQGGAYFSQANKTRQGSNNNFQTVTTVNSAAFQTAADQKTVKTVQSINKSMAKLDNISQLNWSKRDVNLEYVATGNSVFNRVQTTVDPQAFSAKKDISVYDSQNARMSQTPGRSTHYKYTQFLNNDNSILDSYNANRSPTQRQLIQRDIKQDFFKIAGELNTDGKAHYNRAVAAKGDKTSILNMPNDPTSRLFSKIQKKAYRSNQASDTHYIERIRDTKNLLNFQIAPYNIISQKDESTKVSKERPMTTIYTGKCRSQHPLSNFAHLTRLTAPNHNQDYQQAINDNQQVFRRANGPFTDWFNNMNTQKFISVPFKERPLTAMHIHAAGLKK